MEVVRESSESIFAACDAAHGRWAKLLGVRVQVHPKLKLHEFVDIYNATQNFIVATEKVGKVNLRKRFASGERSLYIQTTSSATLNDWQPRESY
jgi:hypothetical protein